MLAVAQRDALVRLAWMLNKPPYNYVVDTAAKGGSNELHLHWFLRIVPQMMRPGGFEFGSDIAINPSLPEDDAATLRLSLLLMTEA